MPRMGRGHGHRHDVPSSIAEELLKSCGAYPMVIVMRCTRRIIISFPIHVKDGCWDAVVKELESAGFTVYIDNPPSPTPTPPPLIKVVEKQSVSIPPGQTKHIMVSVPSNIGAVLLHVKGPIKVVWMYCFGDMCDSEEDAENSGNVDTVASEKTILVPRLGENIKLALVNTSKNTVDVTIIVAAMQPTTG